MNFQYECRGHSHQATHIQAAFGLSFLRFAYSTYTDQPENLKPVIGVNVLADWYMCVMLWGMYGGLQREFVQLESTFIFNHYSHTAGFKSEMIKSDI